MTADPATDHPDHQQPIRWRHRIENAAAGVLFCLFRLLPTRTASALGGLIARGIGRVLPLTKRVGDANLRRALPELDPSARQRILSQVWDNLGRLSAEYALLPRYVAGADRARISLHGHETLAARAREGKPALLFTIHSANWEIAGVPLADTVRPLSVVFRAPNNPLIARRVADLRAAFTTRLIAKGNDAARDMIRALKAGEHVAVLMDQKLNTGVPVPFFGHDAHTAPALVALALRFDIPVFPVRVVRTNGCDFEVTVAPEMTFENTGNKDADIRAGLLRIHAMIEDWVRAAPGQWLWLHRRWPKSDYLPD